jgi:peptide/nickel transport system substrate-binding protein
MNDALFLGGCNINNSIIPHTYEYYWQPPAAAFDQAKAKELLAAAGFPNGFDAGPFTVDSSYSNMGEVAVDYLSQVGIRCRLVPMERAAFASAYANKKLTSGIFRAASGAFGNSATRLASFIVKGGSNVYGSYPDIDELYPLQADELDRKKRAAILEKMQRLVHEKAINAPIWELAFLNGVGPRVGESALGKIAGFPYTAPFEDITIKAA